MTVAMSVALLVNDTSSPRALVPVETDSVCISPTSRVNSEGATAIQTGSLPPSDLQATKAKLSKISSGIKRRFFLMALCMLYYWLNYLLEIEE